MPLFLEVVFLEDLHPRLQCQLKQLSELALSPLPLTLLLPGLASSEIVLLEVPLLLPAVSSEVLL